MKKCPYCAEYIQSEAIVCRFCKCDLPRDNSLAVSIGYNVGKIIARYGFAKILLAIMLLCVILYAVFQGLSGIQTDTTTNRQPKGKNGSIPSVQSLVDDAREKRDKVIVGTPAPAATIPTPAPKGKYDPIAKYGKEKVDVANKVMKLVKQDCNVFVDGGLVVEMNYYSNDKNKLLGYVTAIANADVILFGSARSIFVYDPSKKMIASADALRGIRLRN